MMNKLMISNIGKVAITSVCIQTKLLFHKDQKKVFTLEFTVIPKTQHLNLANHLSHLRQANLDKR